MSAGMGGFLVLGVVVLFVVVVFAVQTIQKSRRGKSGGSGGGSVHAHEDPRKDLYEVPRKK